MTTYAILTELKTQTKEELPVKTIDGTPINMVKKYVNPISLIRDYKRPERIYEWSNDDLSQYTAHVGTNCNFNIGDKDPTKRYNYRCIESQWLYDNYLLK